MHHSSDLVSKIFLAWVQAERHVLVFSATDLSFNSYIAISAYWGKTVFFNFSIMHHSSDLVSKIFLAWVQAETHVLVFSATDLYFNSYIAISAYWGKTVFFNFSIMHHSSDLVSKIFLAWVQAETHVLVFSATDLSFNSYLAISALSCQSVRCYCFLN